MKVDGFFDDDEQKRVLELAKHLKKNCDWTASGSMLVMRNDDVHGFTVYVLRGIVELSEIEKRDLGKKGRIK